jgi:predicted ATPase
LVIALTGAFGSGVTTVSKILEKHGFHRVSLSSNIIRELNPQGSNAAIWSRALPTLTFDVSSKITATPSVPNPQPIGST